MSPQAKLEELITEGAVSICESVYADGSTWHATLGINVSTETGTTSMEYTSKWFPSREQAINHLWYTWKESA